MFRKYESKGDSLNPNITHVMGDIFNKLNDIQQDMHTEVIELAQNIEHNVLRPLNDYQVCYLNKLKIACLIPFYLGAVGAGWNPICKIF